MASNLPVTNGEARFIIDSNRYQAEKPYYLAGPLDAAHEHLRTNTVFQTRSVQFRDLRGNEDFFSLKTHGFQYMVDDRADADRLARLDKTNVDEYAENTLQLMKRMFGTESCFMYAFKVGYLCCTYVSSCYHVA